MSKLKVMQIASLGPGHSFLKASRPQTASAPVDSVVAGDEPLPARPFFDRGITPQLTPAHSQEHLSTVAPAPFAGPDGSLFLMVDLEIRKITPQGPVPFVREPKGLLSEPVVAGDGTLYYLTQDGHLVACDAQGAELFRHPDAGVMVGLSGDGQSLWTAGYDSQERVTVNCKSLDGQPRWSHTLPRGELMAGLQSPNLLLATGDNEGGRYLQAIDPERIMPGPRKWRLPGLDGAEGAVQTGKHLLIRDEIGQLRQLDPETGQPTWTFPGPVKDFYAQNDTVIAVFGKSVTRLDNGAPRWTRTASAPILKGHLANDGRLYGRAGEDLVVVTPDGQVETSAAPPASSLAATRDGLLVQVRSASEEGKKSLVAGMVAGALGGLAGGVTALLSSKRSLKKTLLGIGGGAAAGYSAVGVKPGSAAPAWEARSHQIQVFTFRTKQELLESVRSQFQGGGSVDEAGQHVTIGGVRVKRKD